MTPRIGVTAVGTASQPLITMAGLDADSREVAAFMIADLKFTSIKNSPCSLAYECQIQLCDSAVQVSIQQRIFARD